MAVVCVKGPRKKAQRSEFDKSLSINTFVREIVGGQINNQKGKQYTNHAEPTAFSELKGGTKSLQAANTDRQSVKGKGKEKQNHFKLQNTNKPSVKEKGKRNHFKPQNIDRQLVKEKEQEQNDPENLNSKTPSTAEKRIMG